MKKVRLYEEFANEAKNKYSAWDKLNKIAEEIHGEFGFQSLDEDDMNRYIDLKKADKIASKRFGEFGFATCTEEEMKDIIDNNSKLLKRYASTILESNRSKIHKAAKQGSYPATIVAIENNKVVYQEQVDTPMAVPASFNIVQKKYPNAKLHIEDATGKTLYQDKK